MDQRIGYVWVLTVAIWLVSCSSLPSLPPVLERSTTEELLTQPMQSVHTIGPQDVLQVNIYGEPDLSMRVVVSEDGSYSYPLIGQVKASGLTVRQLEEEMKATLASYLVSPQVSVALVEIRSQQVTVMGEVKAPGTYSFSTPSNLLGILGKAGGPTIEAGDEILVVRVRAHANGYHGTNSQAGSTSIQVSTKGLLTGDTTQNVPIYAGDTIYVRPGGFFYVLGEVQRSGRYRLESDTTVAKALSVAGGSTRFAAMSRLKVQRIIQGKRQEFRVQMTDVLQENDILIVPESVF